MPVRQWKRVGDKSERKLACCKRLLLYLASAKILSDCAIVVAEGVRTPGQLGRCPGSSYSNGSDRPHRRHRTGNSIVFARWRQCVRYLTHGSLGARECVPPLSPSKRRHLDVFSLFAGLTNVSNTQTHRRPDRQTTLRPQE